MPMLKGNVQFINNNAKVMFVFRIFVLIMVYLGSVMSVPLIWNTADLFMGIMATINLFAILLLTPFLSDAVKRLFGTAETRCERASV